MTDVDDDDPIVAYHTERSRLKAAMEALSSASVALNACTVQQELHTLISIARAELQKLMDIKKVLFDSTYGSKGCEF